MGKMRLENKTSEEMVESKNQLAVTFFEKYGSGSALQPNGLKLGKKRK